MPSPVLMCAVGGEREDLAGAAGGEDHRAAEERVDAAADVERDDATPARARRRRREPGDEPLVVAVMRSCAASLEERVEHVEAGLVGGEPGALGFMPPKGRVATVPSVVAAPRAAPVLEPGQLFAAPRSTKASTASWSPSQSSP
jgi:hypothetical protein